MRRYRVYEPVQTWTKGRKRRMTSWARVGEVEAETVQEARSKARKLYDWLTEFRVEEMRDV